MSKTPENKGGKVVAVLLAAGESRRMGKFKQTLPLRGKTFIEHCVHNLLASIVGEVIVVIGHREAEVREALGRCPVRLVHNPDYTSGMSSSIKRGLAAVPEGCAAVMIALADQPLIGTETFNQLVRIYQDHRPLLVIPTYRDRNGHPIIVDLRLKQEILSMDPEQGLRQVVRSHADDTMRVPVESEAVLIDFDVPGDYQPFSS
jgi:molybdenum cofactor cytidylyltransferase